MSVTLTDMYTSVPQMQQGPVSSQQPEDGDVKRAAPRGRWGENPGIVMKYENGPTNLSECSYPSCVNSVLMAGDCVCQEHLWYCRQAGVIISNNEMFNINP